MCLPDGGCAPLHFHVWNPSLFTDSLEFSVLAESCALPPHLDVHPFRQSLRGASPWERVPDLLSAHGMCSHHEWTSYRNALGYRDADNKPWWEHAADDDDGRIDVARLRSWSVPHMCGRN